SSAQLAGTPACPDLRVYVDTAGFGIHPCFWAYGCTRDSEPGFPDLAVLRPRSKGATGTPACPDLRVYVQIVGFGIHPCFWATGVPVCCRPDLDPDLDLDPDPDPDPDPDLDGTPA